MTEKFGRNYRLTIYPLNGSAPILVTMPFTMNFSIIRSISAQMNPADISIFNLSEAHRQQIYQDWYVPGDPTTPDGQPIVDAQGQPIGSNNLILEAGYSNLYRVFFGRMFEASSAREGTNIVTRIKGFDNNVDITSSQTFQTLQSGQTLGDILKLLTAQFSGLTLGAIGDYPQIFQRGVTLNGNTWNLLKQYSNANVYVDNGKIYILRDNEVLNSTTIINDASGILDTPRRQLGALYVTLLFEPSIQVGQTISLQSTVQSNYNGLYRVNGIAHRGTISAAVGGKLTTTLELLAPNQFNGFVTVNQL